MIRALIVALVALLATPAAAFEFSYIVDEPRSVRATRIHKSVRVKAYVKRTEPRRCLDTLRGIGTQWLTTEGAQEAAEKDWTERARYDHGERFMSFDQATDIARSCTRSSIGSVAGQFYYRCEVRARPCLVPMVRDDR